MTPMNCHPCSAAAPATLPPNWVPATTVRSYIATPSLSLRAPTAQPERVSEDLSECCGTMDCIMSELFFDQFDSQVGVIGVLAGPAGVREGGGRLGGQGAAR